MGFNNVDVMVGSAANVINALQDYNTVILKPNIVDNRNVLTQSMMNAKHTKYVIRWNYTLEGGTVTVPEDCIIEFAGGTIDNGVIVGNNTRLIYSKPIDEICKAERQGTWIHDTTVADEEDITSVEGHLKFKDRPATDGMGKVILRKNKSFASQVTEPNTIYVIQYDFILGENITVPENCVLEFDGGSLNCVSGTIMLPSNCRVLGGKIIVTDNSLFNYTSITGATSSFKGGIIIYGNSNIQISNCEFLYDKPNSVAYGIICYGLAENPVTNIKINNCTFTECGVAFWNNTENSIVEKCIFTGSCSSVFCNETCYDFEGRHDSDVEYNYFKVCKNNSFINNYVHSTYKGSNHLLWCSGIDGLYISGNKFEFSALLLMIYCGDLKVALRNVVIEKNHFHLLEGYNSNAIAILVDGSSWVYPSETATSKIFTTDCVIRNNIFDCAVNNYPVLFKKATGISVSLIDSIEIHGNTFRNIPSPIGSYNEKSENNITIISLVKGKYNIHDNVFVKSYNRVIEIAKNTLEFVISDNILDDCNAAYGSVFNILDRINVSLLRNKIKNKATSTTTLCHTYSGGSVASYCKIIGNTCDGYPFNGNIGTQGNLGIFEGSDGVLYGALNSTSGDGVYYTKGQILVSENRRLLYVTKSGKGFNRKTSTLKGNVGDIEIFYSGDAFTPGSYFTIDGVQYKVMFVYNYVMFRTIDGVRTVEVNEKRLVLDKPLSTNLDNQIVSEDNTEVVIFAQVQ